MFDHVTIRATNRDASERFYETVLEALGVDESYRTSTFSEWQEFLVTEQDERTPTTRGLHIGFGAPSREHVDGFWRAGVEAGYAEDGKPGPRPEYGADYYGGFLRDPDGNSAEAVHHHTVRREGIVDHLWVRVADLAESRRFYETIAESAGIRVGYEGPDRVQFRGATGSFSLVAGTPTEHVHLAFGTEDNADVDRFHEAATRAGFRSNGPPGERRRYHPGYYAAFVFDPDGNNIEVVNHNRT